MISILKYREEEYFQERENDYFLFSTVGNILKVAKLLLHRKTHYFDYTGMQIKAITTPSIAFSDLKDTLVSYKGYPMIQGRIGSFGVLQTPYIYVYWHKLPMFDENRNILPYPYALPNNFDLELIM